MRVVGVSLPAPFHDWASVKRLPFILRFLRDGARAQCICTDVKLLFDKSSSVNDSKFMDFVGSDVKLLLLRRRIATERHCDAVSGSFCIWFSERSISFTAGFENNSKQTVEMLFLDALKTCKLPSSLISFPGTCVNELFDTSKVTSSSEDFQFSGNEAIPSFVQDIFWLSTDRSIASKYLRTLGPAYLDCAILMGGDVNGQPFVFRSINCCMQRIDAGSSETGLSHKENRVKPVKQRISSDIDDMRFESMLIEVKFKSDHIKAGITEIVLKATSI